MRSKLQVEIQQEKPFSSLREELYLNLARTAAVLNHTAEHHLRTSGLSPTQYNVLRILRGAGEAGLSQSDIGARLVAEVPDVPRILDRMELAGWVQRTRSTEDRRVVMSKLTAQGGETLGALDEPMMELLSTMFGGMSEEEMARLNELLVAARS